MLLAKLQQMFSEDFFRRFLLLLGDHFIHILYENNLIVSNKTCVEQVLAILFSDFLISLRILWQGMIIYGSHLDNVSKFLFLRNWSVIVIFTKTVFGQLSVNKTTDSMFGSIGIHFILHIHFFDFINITGFNLNEARRRHTITFLFNHHILIHFAIKVFKKTDRLRSRLHLYSQLVHNNKIKYNNHKYQTQNQI